ncbi:hypothetical protein ACFY36_50255 [Actinoplanes sp. NPDC000266]
MTAPGDSVLIFILVAVFFACCGYAAGRLHQKRQSAHDREEAYREGYEKASNRPFDPGPRRAAPSPVEAPPAAAPHPAAPHPAAAHPAPRPAAPSQGSFPVPPPPPPNVRVEPAAVGGVTYQPFPDPRPAAPEQDTVASPAPQPKPSGRHTVPDELVQAKTYRLPADRVFRAKVPDSKPLPEEPTIPSVPKPRRS